MLFAIFTLLSALSLAGIAGWFSIIGIITIYPGTMPHILIMGVVLEVGKLITASWLYRNWEFSNFLLKVPLIVFTITLMIITSIGVFGFLSKAHIEQNSSIINNDSKIKILEDQIQREKLNISSAEKIIDQLDLIVNSYLNKDRIDRSVVIRRGQSSQRTQLKLEIEAANDNIDRLVSEKNSLESEIRKVELETGPIRYIADLFFDSFNRKESVEASVKIFTLLIVLTLDPLAVILLIAANQTIYRLQNEKSQTQNTRKEFMEKDSSVTGGGSPRVDKEEHIDAKGNGDNVQATEPESPVVGEIHKESTDSEIPIQNGAQIIQESIEDSNDCKTNKYNGPLKTLSWLTDFKGKKNE